MPTSREERWAKVRASKQAIDNVVPGWAPVVPRPDIATMNDAEVEAEIRELETAMGLPPSAPAEEPPPVPKTPAPAAVPDIDAEVEAELAAGREAAAKDEVVPEIPAPAEPTPLDDLADLFADGPAPDAPTDPMSDLDGSDS